MTGLTGALRLTRLALRRDRVVLPVWLVSLGGLTTALVASVTGLYATEAERIAAASFGAASPIARVFDGPASGTEPGAMAMVEAYGFLAVLIGVMSAQAVVRHTREDEEAGRAELLGSAIVGRHAPLTAAVTVALGANLLLGALVTVVFAGVHGFPLGGSLLAGAAFAGVGGVFTGVAAVAAQVLSTSRGANATAGAAIGAAFLLRAAGDASGRVAASGVESISAWPSWLSPIGWGQQVRAFHQDAVGPLLLQVALTAVLLTVAFGLTRHRDVGSGMVDVRPGPARAARWLGRPFGLAWRLQRGVLGSWLLALVVLGGTFGAVTANADELLGTSEQFADALRQAAPDGDLGDLFLGFVFGFLGVAAGGYTVQALLRVRAEEASGRLEPVLATALGRTRWLATHVAIAAAGTVTILTAAGVSAGLGYAAVTGDATRLGGALAAGLAQVPAALALGGLVVAVFALLPRRAVAVGWGALAISLVMGQLGALLELPQAVLNLSPFTHVPTVPAEAVTAPPLIALALVASLSTTLGLAAFRRRDLAIAA